MGHTDSFSANFDRLHEMALANSEFDDFGANSYQLALRTLLQAYDATARFSEMGQLQTRAMLVNCLRGRLNAVHYIKRLPKTGPGITKPVFIVGLPRTGTTMLHRLLASLPGNQGLEYWLGSFPQPRPHLSSWQAHPHYQEAASSLEMLDQINPEMKQIHEMRVDSVDECRLLLMQSFVNVTFQANATVPDYADFLYQADMSGAYQLYANCLNMIDGGEKKRWILKDPSHLWALDELLKYFPDALIVQTHRNPVELIPSVASLVLTARRMTEPDISPVEVGQAELDQWYKVLTNSMLVRQQHSESFIDINFSDLLSDPLAAVDAIYSALGEALTEDAKIRIKQWITENPQHKHGGHQYSASDFGLNEDNIRELFTNYCTINGI